jgi:3-phenylpropionate/cinnamic acid dioxygenase small subunit
MTDISETALTAPVAAKADMRDLLTRIEQFLFLEAHLQDTHAYDEWEALWEDDAIYWVPANGQDTDPDKQMSIIYDNRSRIGIRIEQLKTGRGSYPTSSF